MNEYKVRAKNFARKVDKKKLNIVPLSRELKWSEQESERLEFENKVL